MKFWQCYECHKLVPITSIWCQTCGVTRLEVAQAPAVHVFPTGYWEHLDIKPVYIKNKKQLLEVCREKGVRANILD